VGHIPEDRQRHGLIMTFPSTTIWCCAPITNRLLQKGVSLQQKVIIENAEKLVKQFDVRTPNVFVPVSTLSGGNQQKVIVAREFSRPIQTPDRSQPRAAWMWIDRIHSRRIIEKRMKARPCFWFAGIG